MNEPVYKIKELEFNGPLNLLLKLIEKHKVDIFNIPIVLITEQFISYVEEIKEADMEIVSSFLVMVSTLLDIKARMLVPHLKDAKEGENDPREELVNRLLEYKKYKSISEKLKDYEKDAGKIFYREAHIPEELKKYIPKPDLDEVLSDLNLEMLHQIYLHIKMRMKEALNTDSGGFDHINLKDDFSIKECIERIKIFTRNHTSFTFRELLEGDNKKQNVIVSFLAVLELMKVGTISVDQKKPHSDFDVRVKDIESLKNIDLSEVII